MFLPQPIGFVAARTTKPARFPRVCTQNMNAAGVLKLLPEFQPGLIDIEGFSHLFVLWDFTGSGDFDLVGVPPIDERPHGSLPLALPAVPTPSVLPLWS